MQCISIIWCAYSCLVYRCLCFLSLICSVLYCLSVVACAEPRADDDEAEFMDDDLIAGKFHMLKKLLDDSTHPGLFYNHH